MDRYRGVDRRAGSAGGRPHPGPDHRGPERDDQQHRVHHRHRRAADGAPAARKHVVGCRPDGSRPGRPARSAPPDGGHRRSATPRLDARGGGGLPRAHARRSHLVTHRGTTRLRGRAGPGTRGGHRPGLRDHSGRAEDRRHPARLRPRRAAPAPRALRRARSRPVGDPAQPGGPAAGSPGDRGGVGDPRRRPAGRARRRVVLVRRDGRPRHRRRVVCDRAARRRRPHPRRPARRVRSARA